MIKIVERTISSEQNVSNTLISLARLCRVKRSLQKVQGHRSAQGHRPGVDVDKTPPTGGPVGHPPNLVTLCDTVRRERNREKAYV